MKDIKDLAACYIPTIFRPFKIAFCDNQLSRGGKITLNGQTVMKNSKIDIQQHGMMF